MPILIVDGLNLFIRAYAAFPSLTSNGEQIGGAVGFLKILQKLIRETAPTQVFICFESDGSSKRRSILKEYKEGRKPTRLNRFYPDEEMPNTDDNKQQQLITLIELLQFLPICLLYVQNAEADDVIAYLCSKYRAEEKTIASSDSDLHQLLDDKTTQYLFHKKSFFTKSDVCKEYSVTASNFALAKAMCGDKSDNISGIKGLGLKTLAKRFPILGLSESVLLNDVLAFASSHIDESPIYKSVVDNFNIIQRNWKLVYLDGSLSLVQTQKIDDKIQNWKPAADKLSFIKRCMKEGVRDLDIDGLFFATGYLL